MEKNRLIKILNKDISGKSFISEIKDVQWQTNPDDTKKLYVSCVYQSFISDGNGDGYHESEFKVYFFEYDELKKIQREINIDSLLSEDVDVFSIETQMYTDEQLDKLNEMRDKNAIKNPNIKTKHDYYGSFKVGTKVTYKGESGVVTFLHEPKKDMQLRFTIKVRGEEMRYVNPFLYGSFGKNSGIKLLKKRTNVDYSKVEIPKEIKSLSTEQLLKRLNNYRKNSYYSPDSSDNILKAELSTREHVPRKKERKNNRTFPNHGGSKSKSR